MHTLTRLRKSPSLLLLVALTVGSFTGCNYLPTNKPLTPLYYNSPTGPESKNLVVFMRGLGGSHKSFAKEGFVAQLADKQPSYASVAPDAHFGYYTGRSLIARLKTDVIDPAKARGVEHIWLVGVSMGGLGSLLYCTEHPEDIAGVFLISPFLGYDEVEDDIRDAGGLQLWHPGDIDPDKEWQADMWDWIRTKVSAGETPPIYLGYGTEDRYANGQAALADVLTAANVIAIPGAHDYPTFKSLWRTFLETNHLEANDK